MRSTTNIVQGGVRIVTSTTPFGEEEHVKPILVIAMARSVMAASLVLVSAWAQQAVADVLVDVRYTGVVDDIHDSYSVFAGVGLGTSVSGAIRYGTPLPPPVIFGYLADYEFAVTPGGVNQMSGVVGPYELWGRATLSVTAYDPVPGDDVVGSDFQFNDADPSRVSTTGLPAGYLIEYLSTYVGLFSSDPTTVTFPLPPTRLLPLSQYDPQYTGGLFSASIYDGNGHYVEDAILHFSLASLTEVPEPSGLSIIAVGGALLGVARCRRWR
jgi:hypothetical protein